MHADLHVVTLPPNLEMAEDIGFQASDSIQAAYRGALDRHGPDARVAFIPFGRYTVLNV